MTSVEGHRLVPIDNVLASQPALLRRRRSWPSRERMRLVLCLAPVVALFIVVYGASMFRMLLLSLDAPHWSLHQYLRVITDPHLWDVLSYTLGLAAGVTAISLALSYPIALVMVHSSVRVQRLLTLLLVLPLWTSTLVRSYAWMVMLERRGPINEALQAVGLISHPLPLLYNRTAVYIGMVHVMLPFMVFPIYSVMKQIDMRLVRAARSLGAGSTAAMLCIFLPLSLPGVAVGCILVFVIALGFWVTPLLLGGLSDTTYVMVIEAQINVLGNWPIAAAMSVILLAATLLILALYQRLLGFGIIGTGGGALQKRGSTLLRVCARVAARGNTFVVAARRAIRFAPGWSVIQIRSHSRPFDDKVKTPFAWSVTVVAVIFLLGPVFILFPLSFSASPFMHFPPQGYSLRWYETYFSSSNWIDPTIVSFEVAVITMTISTGIGTIAALALAKSRFYFRGALLAFLLSPLIVPPIVIAVALYFQFAPFRLVGTIPGLVLAHLVLCTPFVIVVLMGTMQNFDYSLERAARSLGAGPLRTFRRVILPLIWPGIVTATFFAFLTSFDEVIVAVFLSGTSAETLPKRLLDATRFEFRPTIAAVSVLLITISIIVVLIVDVAQQRRGRQREQTSRRVS